MTTQECIDIMQEQIAGKQIQRIPPHIDKAEWTDWNPSKGCLWDFNYYEYRVKPEPRKPREWWTWVSKECSLYYSPEDAQRHWGVCPDAAQNHELVHVIELPYFGNVEVNVAYAREVLPE